MSDEQKPKTAPQPKSSNSEFNTYQPYEKRIESTNSDILDIMYNPEDTKRDYYCRFYIKFLVNVDNNLYEYVHLVYPETLEQAIFFGNGIYNISEVINEKGSASFLLVIRATASENFGPEWAKPTLITYTNVVGIVTDLPFQVPGKSNETA